MSILISDQKLLDLIHEAAEEKKQSPEQVVAAAIEAYTSKKSDDSDRFWDSIIGLGASGDPTFAERDEEILAQDVDPIRGWGSSSDDADLYRH
jgi:hypothetical protein